MLSEKAKGGISVNGEKTDNNRMHYSGAGGSSEYSGNG